MRRLFAGITIQDKNLKIILILLVFKLKVLMFRLKIFKYDIFNIEILSDGIQVKELGDIPLKIVMD